MVFPLTPNIVHHAFKSFDSDVLVFSTRMRAFRSVVHKSMFFERLVLSYIPENFSSVLDGELGNILARNFQSWQKTLLETSGYIFIRSLAPSSCRVHAEASVARISPASNVCDAASSNAFGLFFFFLPYYHWHSFMWKRFGNDFFRWPTSLSLFDGNHFTVTPFFAELE